MWCAGRGVWQGARPLRDAASSAAGLVRTASMPAPAAEVSAHNITQQVCFMFSPTRYQHDTEYAKCGTRLPAMLASVVTQMSCSHAYGTWWHLFSWISCLLDAHVNITLAFKGKAPNKSAIEKQPRNV